MRKQLIIAGLAVAIAAPTVVTFTAMPAAAQTSCERDRRNTRIMGTVGGGLLGALTGRAIAGHGENTEGMIIGGAVGAVAGNQLTKKQSPCPPGYVARYYAPPARTTAAPARVATAAPRCTWQNQAYRDAYGQITQRQVQVCR